jgi:hypothetical protein
MLAKAGEENAGVVDIGDGLIIIEHKAKTLYHKTLPEHLNPAPQAA